MQTVSRVYSPAASLLAPKETVIVSIRIRIPTFQTKPSHYTDCDTPAGSNEAVCKISLRCIVLKHICAEMVKRVRIGGKHGFYKTGLFPKYITGVTSYTSFVSRKFGGNSYNKQCISSTKLMFFSYFIASYFCDRLVAFSNESPSFTNLLQRHSRSA